MNEHDGKIEIEGKTYDVVTLDYETYYSKEYTLSGKLSTSEYIRDDRFMVHGVAIKHGAARTRWFTGEQVVLALAEIDWSKTALIAHNMAFDGFITSEIYGHVPAFFLDTLSMARGAHGHNHRHNLDTIAKLHGYQGKVKSGALVDTKGKTALSPEEVKNLGAYAKDDVDDTYGIFWKMHPFIPDDELRLIDITIRMFCDPVLEIDIPRVEAELEKEIGGKVAALMIAGCNPEDLLSNVKFSELLRQAGATVPMKLSLSTGKIAPAFAKSDEGFKALLNHSDHKVRALATARLKFKSTIGETRANRFLEAGKDGKKLPVGLNYSGAHTHRWSGANKMNLQNLKRGGELRRSILAPKGHVIVVSDSAQIEARVLAWLAQQADIVNAFATKQDVYKLMASAVYGVKIEDVTPEQRFIGKTCVLGLGFSMGPQKLRATLKAGTMGPSVDVSEEECKRIVQIYRQKNFAIKAFWKKMDQTIRNMAVHGRTSYITGPSKFQMEVGKGFIKLPNDLFLQYFGLHSISEQVRDDLVVTESTYLTRFGRAKLYGGLLTENVVQALARVIIGEQMLKIRDAGYRIVTMSHDEIVVIAPEKEAQKCLDFMIKTMSIAPEWAKGLPLSAEGGFAKEYSK